MRRFDSTPSRIASGRMLTVFIVTSLILSGFSSAIRPGTVEAAGVAVKWPFAPGATWYISQGYNTSPVEGWSHYNCDPATLKDAITQTRSCNQYYQYKYSFDLKRLDGNTTGQTVVSPVNGTIRWIDEAYGGMSINLGNGYAVAYFHTRLAAGLAAGQAITQGQNLGTVAPGGEAGNGGTAHIHFTLWQTTDGGNWSRGAIPFTDQYSVDGYDLPALGDSSKNQHYQKQIVSSNQVIPADTGTPPGTPQLASPATGTTYTTTGPTPTVAWGAVSGATHYQVVVNDGSKTSDWLTGTSWKMPVLANGQYAWQVRAKNSYGTSNLSAKWVFWVDPVNGGTTPTPTGTVTGTPGALGVTLNKTATTVNGDVQANGLGFRGSEVVNLYLDSTSSTAIASVTANSIGSFSKLFSMPVATGGSHSIIARGATSNKQAPASISITPSLSRTPYQGPPGAGVAVTVYGFGANETVRLNFDSPTGAVLGNATTNPKGTGSVNVTMPQATNGWHDYTGTGLTTSLRAWGALYVERIVTLSPASGAAGTTVTVTARGFSGSESVTAGWNRTVTIAGTTVCSGTLSAVGSYSCTFTVPQSVAGSYPVTATSASGGTATATFGVSGPAGISINPTSGAVMTNISINGGGFSPNEQIRLSWDAAATWVTVQADVNGAFLWNATVPNLTLGSHTLSAKGVTSAKTATRSFNVTSTGGNTGSSMISPGTFRVTATIEGLVGHTTSNGHLITPFDHFVALPACTESSCDWLTAGSSSTYVADCNDNCYVRVTNPANNVCSVAPVYDVGPWFTNDNWWDPANKRVLNTRTGAVNQLAQGYTGADAAKNGLDVGYGLSNGIGISNVGYQTGNRAALDIADGTWVDIGFEQAAGVGNVIVSMLWLTGENHTTAAAACGQTTTGLTVTLDSTSGPVGKYVKVSGTGFGASETVKIFFDSTSNPAIISTRADTAGKFAKTIVIPSATNGAHKIIAVGQTTNRKKDAAFTVTDPPKPILSSLSPTQGPAGTTVRVNGKDFLPGEAVKLYLDSSNSTSLASAVASNSGSFSKSIVIPDLVGGQHLILAVGQTTKYKTSRKFLLTPTVTLSPSSGQNRITLTINARGFAANEMVEFFWDGLPAIEGGATTDANGVVRFTVRAPWTNGAHSGAASGATSQLEDGVTFSVVANLKLTPNTGDITTAITMRGTGFAPGTAISIFWNSSSSQNQICSTRSSADKGTFTCAASAPGNGQIGANTIIAIGGGVTASAAFTLSAPVAIAEVAGPTSTLTATPAIPIEATATTQVEPTATPTETPTSTPEPVQREMAFSAIADTSVSAAAPDQPQSPESSGVLSAGGANGELALITFQVEGIAAGTVVNATLVLTGTGAAGAMGGDLLVLPGYLVDEGALTYAGISLDGVPATASIAWIDPGAEIAIDVSGSVIADGFITFAIPGTLDAQVSLGSRESSTPPRLVITVLE